MRVLSPNVGSSLPPDRMNASEPIRQQSLRAPDAVAYVSGRGAATTYATLERTIDAAARRLLALGLGAGQTAALATGDLFRYLVAALALARIGVAHAPITLPGHLTDVALIDAGAQDNRATRSLAFAAFWPDDPRAPASDAPLRMHAGGAATFMICPSSGTTGTPRFVPLSHNLALRRALGRATAIAIAGGAADADSAALRQACLIGPGSSYGFSSHLYALACGGTVLEPDHVERIAAWIVASRVNRLILSPAALEIILRALPTEPMPNVLEQIEIGGATLRPHVYAAARERLCANIVVNYGLTECGRVAGATAETAQRTPGSAGYAYAGVTIEIVDDADRPVPPGAEGAIRIRSDRNASGYVGDPERSAATFRNGWVYPGDRGALDPDGLLRIAGRTDDVINRGGVKVSPAEVEGVLMTLAALSEVAVFGVPGDDGVPVVCAAVVPAARFDADAFHARCRERLGLKAPALIMHMRELLRNANGKVLRSELVRIAIASDRARKTVH